MQFDLSVCSFIYNVFGVISRNICLTQSHKVFFLMFPSRSFIILGLKFRAVIHFELIFVCSMKYGSKSSSSSSSSSPFPLPDPPITYWCLVVLVLLVEYTVISPLNCLCTSVRNQLFIYLWVYICTLYSVSLIYLYFFFSLFFSFFKFYLFILFMAVLGPCFCVRAFSSCGKWGPLFIAVRGPLTIAASLVAEHRLQTRRLSNCGSRA